MRPPLSISSQILEMAVVALVSGHSAEKNLTKKKTDKAIKFLKTFFLSLTSALIPYSPSGVGPIFSDEDF